ncbi:TM2 domain-containing protein [Nymphon striatum]|nr:TM2 domain-containing protein [Nymphon striatum]
MFSTCPVVTRVKSADTLHIFAAPSSGNAGAYPWNCWLLFCMERIFHIVKKREIKKSTSNIKERKIQIYLCPEPKIDEYTQQPEGCTKNNVAKVNCSAVFPITCKENPGNDSFEREIPCRYTNGCSFKTSLLLSVFLGMFGIDRFYLGYPAIGLLKLCTLGFMFLGQLIDIILIATQVVGPADNSSYIVDYYGPILIRQRINNDTYILPQDDW